MASITAVDPPPPPDRLSLESIPTVDLRLLTQSELTALSLCSSHAFDLRRCDDVVIPKIDRSVFNESAGSRKQTYSRLRLAPRKPDLSSPGPTSRARPEPEPLDSERAENSRIIALFKHLFNSSNDSSSLVPISVQYSDPLIGDGLERKRKRGRKPKNHQTPPLTLAAKDDVAVTYERGDVKSWEETEKELRNKNGVAVDLSELAKMEDPYASEIRRRTEGREKPEELLRIMTDLNGQWGSRRKKRKIVDANEFGDALPNGWKVLIAMKKKQGLAWLYCRRYISPNGRYCASCNEVSSYLLSLTSPQDLKQRTVQCTEDPMVNNDLASGNVGEIVTKVDDPSLSVAFQFNHENQLCTSQTIDFEKHQILSNSVHTGEVQETCALKCHKCSTPFIEKDKLLNHLLSCHKRKRRKAGEPIEDDILMKDGKYECQFCNKIFHERNSYFGHVGIHVKNYVKSIGGSPSVTPKQKTCGPISISGGPGTVSETLGSMEVNPDSAVGTPNNPASSEPNISSINSKLKAISDGEIHSDNSNTDQNNFSLHVELNVEDVRKDRASAAESSESQDEIVHKTDNNVRELDEAADNSSGKVLSNNENHDLCDSGEINATESGIRKSPAVLVGNDGNFDLVSVMESGGVASENGHPADNNEKSSSDQNSEDRSLENNTVEHSCYDEEVKVGKNDELMVGPDSGHLDLDMDAANDVEHKGHLEESLEISHEVEETCDIAANKITFTGSTLTDSKLKTGSENSPCTSSGNQQSFGNQNYVGNVFTGIVNETEVKLCSLGNAEGTIYADCCISQGRPSESSVRIESQENGSSYNGNGSEKVPVVTMLESRGTGGSPVEQTCSLENSTGKISSKKGKELKSDQVANSSNLFFTSLSNDAHLESSVMTNNERENTSAGCPRTPSDNREAHGDVSDVLGDFNDFVEDKQEHSKSILSGFSIDERMDELDKVEGSRTNKLIFDFSNMTEINPTFLNSVQNESIPEGSSPFSLWDEQTCGVEANQTRLYGGGRGVAHQERVCDDNSRLAGLAQPCDSGYNLNMNEQRYVVQHNDTGVYNRSNEARRGGTSHGNSLNLAVLQQQCDAGYNLNKSCINQQSFAVQHNSEAGAYGTSDGARREKVAYGNSLSLASAQQTCDSRYSLNKECVQQTCDTGYGLSKGFTGGLQGFSKLGELEHSRDRDLMIGFGNSDTRPNQDAATEFLWRSTEGNMLPGGLVNSSSSQGQSPGSFQAFDFLSDKGGNDLYNSNEKYSNISSFEGLRTNSVEPMEFSFLTSQDSNAQMEHPKVLSYNPEMDQAFGSSMWHQKGSSLPNMNIMGGHVVTTMCVWCGNEFHQDSLGCEMQAGSIGYLCPTCKARMSGQFL